MGLFGKKNVAPDIGEEPGEEEELDREEETDNNVSKDLEIKKSSVSQPDSGQTNVGIEQLRTRIIALQSLMQGFFERFSQLNQQVGEVRTMALSNEKTISKSAQIAEKAASMVEEVQPQELNIRYQKIDGKIDMLDSKIEAEKQFKEGVMKELGELRKKSESFIGTEALLKLNEETKGDLINVQKSVSEIRAYSSKVEEIFAESRKSYIKVEKLKETVENLNSFYGEIKKVIEKLKVNYSQIVNQDNFEDFRDSINKRFSRIENFLSHFENIPEKNEEITRTIENTLAVAKRNRRDIDNLALAIGDEGIQKVSDIEDRVDSILKVIDVMSQQISELRKTMLNNQNEVILKKENETKTLERENETNEDIDKEKIEKGIRNAKFLVNEKNFEEASKEYLGILEVYNSLSDEKKDYFYKDIKETYEKIKWAGG